MKLRLTVISVFALVALSVMSQGAVTEGSDVALRKHMRSIVAEGNNQYMRSYRPGIKAAADALDAALDSGVQAGILCETDYMEFLADLYKLRGDWHYENIGYDEDSAISAERFFLNALTIYEEYGNVFGYDLDKIPAIQRELAQLYYRCALYEDAYNNVCLALEAFDDAYLNRLFVPGDALYDDWIDLWMQKAMCLARLERTEEALNIIDKLISGFEKGSERYYETLRKKAKIHMLSRSRGSAEMAFPLYREYYEWKKLEAIHSLKGMTRDARQDFWMRMRPFVTDCFQLEGEEPGFIFDVALFSKGLLLRMDAFDRDPKAVGTLELTWKDVQRNLPAGACAIEFVQYEKNGEDKMGAVVVRKTGIPQWVTLIAPSEFMQYETKGMSNESRMYSSESDVKNAIYLDGNLIDDFWNESLLDAIGDSRKIYFSPDGYIHQLAIEYLLPVSLSQREFYRLSSFRQLVAKREFRLESALMVGGMTYMSDVPFPPGGNDALAYDCLSEIDASFSYLPGTKKEVESIFSIRDCKNDTLIIGKIATEPVIRSLMGQYDIFHISTHGFFNTAEIPQGTDLKPCLSDESLSQSSLALSGANSSLQDPFFDTSRQDGILSSAEIASLDMSKVNLAVISACQTALGKITADGVYGIQRGLKNAGVGAMIVSLWNIDDEATVFFMTRFYRNIIEGMNIREAFWKARQSFIDREESTLPNRKVRKFNPKTMSAKYVSPQDYCEPKYYNAFILIDAL